MDNRAEVSAFLKSRRDKITPEQAGLPVYGQRRVAGLRRNEVATLAGVSVEYYTRLERGNLSGVSDHVLDALAQALRLDDTERTHLYDLARAANTTPARARRRTARPAVRPSVQRIVDGMPGMPAFVKNHRFDILVANPLGRALFSEMYADPVCGANTMRFAFLSPAARRLNIGAGDGDPSAFQRINSKDFQAATVPEPLSEQGWQIIDEFNRSFAGKPASGYVAPVHVTTAATSGGALSWDSEGYREAYRRIWGK
ncbi:helix-turn-helix domain-containing protein [Streptomyces collinus]|uniref:MmyB family transcriptional regulator n=1 Tax=Streptomyces collinus TaxID=42684 RepID=UPI0033F38983